MKKNNIKKNVLLLLLCWMMGSGMIWAQDNNFHTKNGDIVFSTRTEPPADPETGMIYLNTADRKFYWYDGSEWVVFGSSLSMKPTVGSVALVGILYVGNEITGSYTYVSDPAAGIAEGTSIFQWYTADDVSGTGKTAISGANTASYTIAADKVGKYLAWGVTPVSQLPATGNEVLSDWQYIYMGSITANVNLSNNSALYKGQVLNPESLSFDYSDGLSSADCAESGATYVWYRNSSSASKEGAVTISEGTGTSTSYTVLSGDVGQYIGLELTPNNACNAAITSGIDWKQVIALTPSIATVEVSGTYSDGTTTYALKNTGVTASFTGYSCTPVQPDGDSGSNSTFQWYWSSDDGTTRTAEASDGSTSTYTVNTTDASYTADAKLACGITPVSSNGDTGTERIGEWLSVPSLTPAYADVTIGGAGYNSSTGKVENEKTITAVTGNFLSGISGLTVPAGTPAYRWVYSATGGSDAGTDMTNLGTPQLSSHAVDVTAGHGYTDDTYYIGVYVTAMAGNGESGTSEVFSGWKQVSTFECGVSTVTFLYNDSLVTYGTIESAGGQCWLDRDLGARNIATSWSDADGGGDLFQWGRADDGHQKVIRGSTITNANVTNILTGPSNSNTPDTLLFYTGNPWCSELNDSLWYDFDNNRPGANNPCPDGWHVPTPEDWQAEIDSLEILRRKTLETVDELWFENLGMVGGGMREPVDGRFRSDITNQLRYWSSKYYASNDYASLQAWPVTENSMVCFSNTISHEMYGRAYPIRCIKNE